MVKPFSFEELLARIYARIRNQFPTLFGNVVVGPFHIDDRRKEIKFHNRVLELTPTEYELLKFLVLNHGLVLSKVSMAAFMHGLPVYECRSFCALQGCSLVEEFSIYSGTIKG